MTFPREKGSEAPLCTCPVAPRPVAGPEARVAHEQALSECPVHGTAPSRREQAKLAEAREIGS